MIHEKVIEPKKYYTLIKMKKFYAMTIKIHEKKTLENQPV